MIQYLTPAQSVSFLAFLARSMSNQACPLDQLEKVAGGHSDGGIGRLLDWLSPGRPPYAWVSMQRGRMEALVALRPRCGSTIWEIERLMVRPGAEEACQELLEQLPTMLVPWSVHRLFLRVPTASVAAELARRAGFTCYQHESIYRLEVPSERVPGVCQSLRPRYPADDHNLFRLYSACVPVDVRMAEGMTLSEWSAMPERSFKGKREWVLERQKTARGWVRLGRCGPAWHVSMLVHPDAADEAGHLLDVALSTCPQPYLYATVPHYNNVFEEMLRERNGCMLAEMASLVSVIAVRVQQRSFLPAGV